MSNFYLICGISGGGKTVLSRKIIDLNPGIVMFDVDEYYKKVNGDECIRTHAFNVWHALYQDIHNMEIEGKDVLLTANALTLSQRRQFIEWFPTFSHHILWVTAPFERCVEGNLARNRHVPLEILKRQWQTMEFPNASEDGWDTITHITNCWDNENYIIFNLKGNIENLIEF